MPEIRLTQNEEIFICNDFGQKEVKIRLRPDGKWEICTNLFLRRSATNDVFYSNTFTLE